MELYQKPVMEIVELEKVDVLTCSIGSTLCTYGCTKDHPHKDCNDNCVVEEGDVDLSFLQ